MKCLFPKCAVAIALALLSALIGQYTNAYAQESKAASQGITRGQAIRPHMPDGLYMSYGRGATPFLLVEKGQWIDPYEWVHRNGIDALNARFVVGREFEWFNVHTWLKSIGGVTLQSLSLQQLLVHGRLKSNARGGAEIQAPRLSGHLCGSGGVDLWACKETGILTKYRPPAICTPGVSSFGCGKGLIAPATAYRELTRGQSDPGILHLADAAVGKQIEVEFKSLSSTDAARNRVEVSAYRVEIFYGPAGRRLVSGFMKLAFRTNIKWKPRYSGDRGPIRESDLGFIWDVDRARFVYLQAASTVLDKQAQVACDSGGRRYYCARALPVGMWESGGKLYAVWQYSQPFADYIPAGDTLEGSKTLMNVQYQIHEVDLENALSSTIFQTRIFLGID